MSRTTTDLAIVLKSTQFQERHQIITALTENHGKISAIARNSIQSRRFGGTLELFAASEWKLTEQRQGSELLRIEEAQIKRPYTGLRQDLKRLSLASAFNEIILRIAAPDQPCGDLFKLHSNALAVLEELEETPTISLDHEIGILLNAYLAKILQWNGNQPQFDRCLQCQKPLSHFVKRNDISLACVISEAAWICSDCGSGPSNAFEIPPTSILDFILSIHLPIREFMKKSQASFEGHQKLFRLLESLLIYHIPGFDSAPLKSLKFLGLESSLKLQAENSQ